MSQTSATSITKQIAMAAETAVIGGTYIAFSAGLITFNKYMLKDNHFPHAAHLTVIHMAVTTVLSLFLYIVAPQIYPSMGNALAEWKTTLRYICPLGVLFALALYTSNQAYRFSSVAFLQFCKQGNVALVFAMACCLGLQRFSWTKLAVLSVVIFGCSFCAHGQINFVLIGFALQLFSQVCECSKNLVGEIVMSSAGMKLDVLTFVFFQAPCSLVPLLAAAIYLWEPAVGTDLVRMWPLLLANACLAFCLNILIALTIKRLSALAFVIIGLLKDGVIVASSALVFLDPISRQQEVGFAITLIGIAMWSHLKMQEAAEAKAKQDSEPQETEPLLAKKQDEGKV
eukprot:TRINITY_DN34126_c0_g1_i1.p1 TRINITY_DN34126_c0_g1~~TRINITY_DN34126_c0_g1_i1.p1  ORF type:complete len:342 (+),score=57.78 TRINITY_DN34126_c0_g1_i1:63-1088(+)